MAGETSIQAVIREIKEELDIDINSNQCKYLFTIRRQNICNRQGNSDSQSFKKRKYNTLYRRCSLSPR